MPSALTPYAINAGFLLVFVAALAITMTVVAWLIGGAWWPSVAFQLSQRAVIARRLMWQSLLMAVGPSTIIWGSAGLAAGLMLWVFLAPRWIAERASAAAWAADSGNPDLRTRALAIRNRRRELAGEPLLDGTAPWPQYIIDVAKAERQRRYQEQFDRVGRETIPSLPPRAG